MKIKFCFFLFIITLISTPAFAQRGGSKGGVMFGLMGGFVNSEQQHLNVLRGRANLRAGGISASDLDRAYEFGPFIGWRAGMLGFQLRPNYFTQSEGEGAYEYSTKGYNMAAHFRIYPLESADLRLFFETGVAWGKLETTIKEDTFTVKADGTNIGYLLGVGTEICFGPHNIILEAGWRFLPIERNIVRSVTGTPAADSVSQSTVGGELEYDGRDLSTNMSGTKLQVGYGYSF